LEEEPPPYIYLILPFSLLSLLSLLSARPPQKKNKIGEKSASADFSPILFFFEADRAERRERRERREKGRMRYI